MGAPGSRYSFSGHETFVFRYGWLKKAVDAVLVNPSIFSKDHAIVELGVGKNMLRSIRHWGLATRVLEEVPKTARRELRPSALGILLFGAESCDPFLEDPASLWLLHWQLASSEERCTSWYWCFNRLSPGEFSRDRLLTLILDELESRGYRVPSIGTLRRDVDVLIRTYAPPHGKKSRIAEDSFDCPLAELGLIRELPDHGFEFQRGPKPGLSDSIFAHCIESFWDARNPDRETLLFQDIAYASGSPGNIFKLDEMSLSERLEKLEDITEGALVYGETAGLKQVYRRRSIDKLEFLQRHYDCAPAGIEV